MTEPIRGKVAAVLNEREIALNIGSAKGVFVGMYFDVMSLESGDIRDPDTGEVLGSIERPKVRVQVTEVNKKFSVASTCPPEIMAVNPFALGPFARALMPSGWLTKYELSSPPFDSFKELDSYVDVGDPVRQVLKAHDAKAELENVNR